MASAGHRAPPAQFVQQKASFFRGSGVLLESENVCRQWGGGRGDKRERERERNNNKMEMVVRIGKARMASNGGGGC